jgi:5-hydroxyisourate hydrolase
MGKLTTHVLDLASGIPAAGMLIELHDPAASPADPLAAGRTSHDGRLPKPLLDETTLRAGRYILTFHVADYFRSQGRQLADPPFLEEVRVQFGIADPAQNYHVPLLISPWSYSTYRGS